MKKNVYTLSELVDVNIDSWVSAISALDDIEWVRSEAVAMASEDTRESWESHGECPAELENEITAIANRDNFRFDSNGRIISFDRSRIG